MFYFETLKKVDFLQQMRDTLKSAVCKKGTMSQSFYFFETHVIDSFCILPACFFHRYIKIKR